MVDFFTISTRSTKRGVVEIYPKFKVGRSKDLMIRGGDFYAIWLEDKGLWSTDEEDVIRLIDRELDIYAKNNRDKFMEDHIVIRYMWDSDSGMIDIWHKYCQRQQRDNYSSLDENLIFSNQETNKEDYASKRLGYSLEEGPIEAYNELMSVLYSEDERHKIEWAIGAIVTGASKTIQKFLVLYGAPGTGKGTVLEIVMRLFNGYYSVFDAETLGSANAAFALEQFKSNPLVAISADGDLSHIERNTTINSLTSHEQMTVNEKHKALYSMRFKCFLFMGTNKPVKITDAKSGIIRRLIDVNPTGNLIPHGKYKKLMKQIDFELGHIAQHCKEVYLEAPDAYDNYRPIAMMGESNDFYNFVEDSYPIFKAEDGVSLKSAWEMYKVYIDEAKVPYPFSMRIFKTELKNYFREYEERVRVNENWVRSYYSGFKTEIFDVDRNDISTVIKKEEPLIEFKEQPSNLDIYCADCPAQYGNDRELPRAKWDNVKTTLSDIDTSKLHYLKVPENLIVIDFDIKDEQGNKSFERNLEEASKWPKTYAELSKSGGGIHLHYIYNGDTSTISRIYADSIEIKIFTGNSSLRRRVTKCNNEKIATISSGLPVRKGGTKVINREAVKNEKALRTIIRKSLKKEYLGATKPEMDYINYELQKAYDSGMKYDVSDLYSQILNFAANSTNQADYCLNLLVKMKFKSDGVSDSVDISSQPIVFYDVEVFPNLFLVNWKYEGNKNVVRMINPSPKEIETLLKYKLVGFNCRRYDNHMMYARMIGYSNEELYYLSQRIIGGDKSAFFGEAYNLSYTDIYDYASKKQSLKKWEIELGIHHLELGLPWDKPVPEELWTKVAEYCDNDVISTEAVWNATKGDFTAREILAEIAGMSVNDTTNSLTTRIIFGRERKPVLNYENAQKQLLKEFPGYEFVKTYDEKTKRYIRQNIYRDTDLGFGGYVYSQPGMYGNIALVDVASLHPHSIKALNLFGEYTKNFTNIMDTRIYIKHKEYDKARKLFDGKLAKYLDDESTAKQLSQALKIAINSVYGLTSASFDNPFRDGKNNENNIVALRGALFMRTLQDEVISRGFKVAHIKTDSIKIPDATPEIIQFCMDFAQKFGYTFEHEATYDRMTLVNDAVYIAKYKWPEDHAGEWTATGTQFQIPYVYKKCFSHEDITFHDLCEAKEVKTAMYLHDPVDGSDQFIGRVGLFCPIKEGCGGKELYKTAVKIDKETGNEVTKMDSVVGTKGYLWLESEDVYERGKQDDIDISYYTKLVDIAIEDISQYGDYEWFVSDDPYQGPVIFNGRPQYEDYCPF